MIGTVRFWRAYARCQLPLTRDEGWRLVGERHHRARIYGIVARIQVADQAFTLGAKFGGKLLEGAGFWASMGMFRTAAARARVSF